MCIRDSSQTERAVRQDPLAPPLASPTGRPRRHRISFTVRRRRPLPGGYLHFYAGSSTFARAVLAPCTPWTSTAFSARRGDSAGGVPFRTEGGVRTLLQHVNHVQQRANSSAGTSVPSRFAKAPDDCAVINSVPTASPRTRAHLGAVDALGRDVLSSRLTPGSTAAGTAEMSAEPRDSSTPVLRSAPRRGTRDRTRGRPGLPTGNHRHPSVQNSA